LKLTQGGCPTCELINSFTFSWENEIKETENVSLVITKIQEIDRIMSELEEYEYECFEPKALESDRWEEIRTIASSVLAKLNLEIATLPEWNAPSPGVKQRDFMKLKSTTSRADQ